MPDFSEITKSLLRLYPFSAEQQKLFTDRLDHKHLKKKEFLLSQGHISEGISFILSGSFRFYSTTENGESTLSFFTENSWVADLESLLTQLPSKNHIQALENSEIVSMSLKELHLLMDIHSSFNMLNGLLASMTISTHTLVSIQTKSPDERYKDLLLSHPQWIKRFPQMYIASYLGITPETLSRVRARLT